ncbi:MAG: hypothetical protein ISP45_04180 [Reyranella sp.]|nr:hypothetical protein [Reyranella sp.]
MRHRLLAALVLLPALLFATDGLTKACEENTGGACKGHWKCDDNDSSKVCTDYLTRSGYECRCMKGTSRHVFVPLDDRIVRGHRPIPSTTQHPPTQP